MQPLLVLGGSGLVGTRFRQLCQDRLTLLAPDHAALDVLDTAQLDVYLQQQQPRAVLNLAAWADVDGAEAQYGDVDGSVHRLNAGYPGALAELCSQRAIYLMHVSTDYVFDGANAERAYAEDDVPNPLGWYAQTKLDGERAVLASGGDACIVRIEMPFTAQPFRKTDFARLCAARLRQGQPIAGVVDQHITPVFLDDATAALLALIERRVTGIVHVAAASWTTPYEYARSIATRLGLELELVQETTFAEFTQRRAAQRPQHSWLAVDKAASLLGKDVLRSVDEQLDAWAAQLREATAASKLVR